MRTLKLVFQDNSSSEMLLKNKKCIQQECSIHQSNSKILMTAIYKIVNGYLNYNEFPVRVLLFKFMQSKKFSKLSPDKRSAANYTTHLLFGENYYLSLCQYRLGKQYWPNIGYIWGLRITLPQSFYFPVMRRQDKK